MTAIRSLKVRQALTVILGCLFIMGMVLPMVAQDTALTQQNSENATIVTGPVTYGPAGEILVGGYVIAPASAFNPSSLSEGDVVIIIGWLLPDGMTIQAQSLEFFVEPEITPELTPEVTPEMTPEATPETTPEATPEATDEPIVCGNPSHPIATRIAEDFGVSYEEVMSMHCAGNGFGNIVRAYLLAEASEGTSTAQSFLDRHSSGEGWGNIVRESGVHPSQLAPGQARTRSNDDPEQPESESEAATNTRGNGNGGGNGNAGGNGNGGGNGNAGGNGKGKGK